MFGRKDSKGAWYAFKIILICFALAIVLTIFVFSDFKSTSNIYNYLFKDSKEYIPSILNAIIIPLGGFIGIVLLYIRTKAADNQAKTTEKTHTSEIVRNTQKDFEKAIYQLDEKTNVISKYAALTSIKNIATTYPDKFYFTAQNILIIAGREISKLITINPLDANPNPLNLSDEESKKYDHKNQPIEFSQTDYDNSEFVFKILETIVEINNNDCCYKYYKSFPPKKNKLVVQGFNISIRNPNIKSTTRWKTFSQKDFGYFTFEQCNLKRIEFYQSNLSNTIFIDTIGLNFHSCLVNYITLENVNGSYKGQITNNANSRNKIFIWCDDKSCIMDANKQDIKYEKLNSTKYKREWESMKFPKTPKTVYSDWMIK